jgi:D-alanyl-lipoteichoic acid acyltransferase DltB (MBOAT superfamily)
MKFVKFLIIFLSMKVLLFLAVCYGCYFFTLPPLHSSETKYQRMWGVAIRRLMCWWPGGHSDCGHGVGRGSDGGGP